MKRTLCALCILFVIIAIALLFHGKLNRDITHLEAELNDLRTAAEVQNWPSAIASAQEMDEDWQRISPFYSLFIDQALLDVTEGLLCRAITAVRLHNRDELFLTCANISLALQNIRRNESLHWSVAF